MQMLALGAVGPAADGLTGARLLGAVMRVFSAGEVRLASHDRGSTPSSSSRCCRTHVT